MTRTPSGWPASHRVSRARVFRPQLVVLEDRALPAAVSPAALASASASLEYLRQVMDQFHTRFPVYDDVSSAGNHFHALAKLPDENAAVDINGSWTDNPHSGATAIRNVFTDVPGANFGGWVFQNGVLQGSDTVPRLNFGTVPGAGIDLTGATGLTFWARGAQGGEKIEFFMGGVGYHDGTGNQEFPYPDSLRAVKLAVTLTSQWQQYRIDLTGRNLSYVLGGFGWDTSDNAVTGNPGGAVFYLDDIQYELSAARRDQRLNEPRFLQSYTTEPFQSLPPPVGMFDLVLRNTAFTYDNALAVLAFLADGSADSLRRARLVGDALVYASQHDRTFDDGRLRSAYAAGDIALPPGWTPNGRPRTVPAPGFYDETQHQFFEVEQSAIDTGNNAWATIALLALYRRTNNSLYLDTARQVGSFIRTFRNDTGRYQGFQGGIMDPESPTPTRRTYASTEHNLDVAAAFATMYRLTREPVWLAGAAHARAFVEAMWDSDRQCFLTGTTDPDTRNTISGQLPLDVQAWSTLALPGELITHPQVLACAEANHRLASDGFSGFDFNEDRDGVWFEGTAQMATAYALAGQPGPAEAVRQELRRAQQTAPFGDGHGLAAASHDGLSTGFNFSYFRRLHVGATAWNVFAQLAFNPFTQPGFALGLVTGADAGGGPHVQAYDAQTGRLRFSFFAYDASFRGGARVATGDLTGDGFPDIITAAGPGGGPHVRAFDGLTGQPLASPIGSFFAYDANFTGGVYAAAGDVTGDGIADIITGAGEGGGPHVKVFDGTTGAVVREFFAYDAGFTGGARVAAGNVAGHTDGRADIVTAAGPGGGPHVKVFSGADGSLLTEFFAYDASFRGGVNVAAGDINGDGIADVVTGAGVGGGPHVKVFSGADGSLLTEFFAYDASFRGGVRVAAGDVTGDGRADLITGAGPGGGPHVKVWEYNTTNHTMGVVDELFAYDPAFLGGVFVGSH